MFYQNENNVTYLLITMPIYPLSVKVLCIKSLKKEIADGLFGRNFNAIGDYGLNELQEKLKLKLEYFNENNEFASDSIQGLKNEMMKFKDEVFKAAESLNERGDLLNEMQNKAKDLESDSYSYNKTAGDVRKLECHKKFVILEIFAESLLL